MRRPTLIATALLALIALLSACGGGSSGPLAVQSVTLSNAENGPAMTTFSPSDHTIHARILLNRTEPGLSARVVWTAVDTTAGQDVEVASSDFTSVAANTINAEVELPNDWPTGSYKMDVYLNSALANTTTFTIQ